MIRLFGTEQEKYFENERRWFRGSFLAPKDHAIMWGLFTVRVMSAVQITAELFPGQQVAKARSRLNRLREKGLVVRVRGGRATGSEPYLWSLTQKGFRALADGRGNPVSVGSYRYGPQAWLVPKGAKFQPWGWANIMWGSDLPARISHDLQTTDFLISYRRLVDSLIKTEIGDGTFLTEWRGEHAFMPPLDKHRDEPMKLDEAVRAVFREYDEPASIDGYPDEARLQVVKPDGALSIVLTNPGSKKWRSAVQPAPWETPPEYSEDCGRGHFVVDILVEYDRTGRFSDNQEKLEGLDKFLNIGRHLIKYMPVICLKDSEYHTSYEAEVLVLFVCPRGRAHTIMEKADEILTGHLYRDGDVYYAGRERILFCEADAFGNITADIKAHEHWLREPPTTDPHHPSPKPAAEKCGSYHPYHRQTASSG